MSQAPLNPAGHKYILSTKRLQDSNVCRAMTCNLSGLTQSESSCGTPGSLYGSRQPKANNETECIFLPLYNVFLLHMYGGYTAESLMGNGHAGSKSSARGLGFQATGSLFFGVWNGFVSKVLSRAHVGEP